MKSADIATLNTCVDILTGQLVSAQLDLQDLRRQPVVTHAERDRIAKLESVILSLDHRLQLAALSSPD